MATEWSPTIPACVKCGAVHWGEWIVFTDEGPVGAPCLTEVERSVWCKVHAVGHGKVHAKAVEGR